MEDNTIKSNSGHGIYLVGSDSNTMEDNTINRNSDYGIYLTGSDSNTISNNTIKLNGAEHTPAGIYLKDSDDNTISNNIIENNEGSGIYLSNSNGNTISNNTIIDNSGEPPELNNGIYLTDSDSNTISNNTLSDNEDYEVYLDSGSDDNILIGNVSDVYVSSNSDLTIKNYLTIQVKMSDNLINGSDIQIKDNSNILYATSYYNGSDAKTVNGTIRMLLITDRIYDGNSTATENITELKVKYGITQRPSMSA